MLAVYRHMDILRNQHMYLLLSQLHNFLHRIDCSGKIVLLLNGILHSSLVLLQRSILVQTTLLLFSLSILDHLFVLLYMLGILHNSIHSKQYFRSFSLFLSFYNSPNTNSQNTLIP